MKLNQLIAIHINQRPRAINTNKIITNILTKTHMSNNIGMIMIKNQTKTTKVTIIMTTLITMIIISHLQINITLQKVETIMIQIVKPITVIFA